MTEQLMSHQEAVQGMAVERYLLGEMKEEEQAAFEAHYLNCAVCLEAVTFAGEFMQTAEPLAREVRAAEQRSSAAPSPQRSTLFANLGILLRGPAPAWALALILAAVVGYQSINRPKPIGPEARFVLTGLAHGTSGIQQIQIPANRIVSLGVEYARSGEFLSYEAKIFSDTGKLEFVIPLPPDQPGNIAFIGFKAGILHSGEHTVVISGRNSDGVTREVGRGQFELRFTSAD
jgi:hypothetical protein